MNVADFLQTVDAFRCLGPDSASRLANRVEVQDYAAGDKIIERGGPGDSMFIIAKGSVQVPILDEQAGDATILFCSHRFDDVRGRVDRVLELVDGRVAYDGAAPFCGVMGDTALFDYFGDFARGAETNAGLPVGYPPAADYGTSVLPLVIGSLFQDFGAGFPAALTAAGEQQKALTEQLSGGERPLFDAAFPGYQTLLFSFAGSNGDVDGVVSGNLYDNVGRTYQFDGEAALSAEEQAFNDAILRIARDPGVNRERLLKLERIPTIHGRLAIPVVSVHTLGDLFVPFSMQQIYAREAIAQARQEFLVSRATRALGHCEFSSDELVESFQAMVDWVNSGERPPGDDILDPTQVADPAMGCAFTRGSTGGTPAFLRACP